MVKLRRIGTSGASANQEVAVAAARLCVFAVGQCHRRVAVIRIRAVVIPADTDRTGSTHARVESQCCQPLAHVLGGRQTPTTETHSAENDATDHARTIGTIALVVRDAHH